MTRLRLFHCVICVATVIVTGGPAYGQLEYEREPINYSKTQPDDAISRLKAKIEDGSLKLTFDDDHGWLKSLLKELKVLPSSQTLVFSKSSLQRNRITPRRPRAVYFNDDIYVGWVQFGRVIELSAVDPNLGAVFYTLDQHQSDRPVFQQRTEECLICHGSTHTGRIPGHIMRSLYTERSGQPLFGAGTYRTNDASPFKERWGGWYVTGTHGRLRHLGNEVAPNRNSAEELDVEAGANVTDLSTRFRTTPYLTPHSDIAALMVLGHQVSMHNVLTSANYAGRRALYDVRIMNRALDRPADYQSDSTHRRLDAAARDVVRALLMQGEAKLGDPVAGTTTFAADFANNGPQDSRGRSLRQLDLQTRLLRYPCSYLIYSEAFGKLPREVLDRVFVKLNSVLTSPERDEEFPHLADADRRAIHEILRETLPAYRAMLSQQNVSEKQSPKSVGAGS